MNRTIPLLVLLCVFAMSTTFAQVKNQTPRERANYYLQEKGEVVFQFKATSQNQFKELARFLSISHKVVDPVLLRVEAYANKDQFEKFLTYGLPFEVNDADNVFEADEYTTFATAAWDDTWNAYPRYSQYVAKMQYWASAYPNLCKLEEIGTTIRGRKLLVLKISDNAQTHETEPEFLYTSSMHGDEITGYPTMLRFIDYLLTRYSTDPEVANIVNNTQIYICPLANPDGSYRAATNDIYNSSGNTATRGNANNIDLNRNYPDAIDGLHPDNQAYQPETAAFMNFEKNHNFVLAANYHGGVEVINFPWDTSTTPGTSNFSIHPHDNYFKFISTEYAHNCQEADNNQNYMDDVINSGQYPGTTNGAAWYSVYGGRQDWNNFFNHNKEITIEISAQKTPSAANLPFYWDRNRKALLDFVKQANYGLQGKVTDASGNPVSAKVYVASQDKMGSWVKTGILGDYYKVQIAGNYNVIFEAPGYISQTRNVTISNNFATVLNVQMVATTAIPLADDVTICENQSANLSATGSNLQWFDSINSTTVLGSGNNFTSPNLTASRSYFVESQTLLTAINPTGFTTTNVTAANSANRYSIFNATVPVKLKSVEINLSNAGDVLIELQNSTGEMLESKVVSVPSSGRQEVILDFFVPAQNNLRLVLRESTRTVVTATSGYSYPLSNEAVSITGNSGSGNSMQFFNWKFDAIKSPRQEVIVNVQSNPVVETISPSTQPAGSESFILTVNGSNFVNGQSIIRWNNVEKTTTFVSSTQLTANVSAADLAVQGNASVTVFNTCNNVQTTAATFIITAPTTTTWNGTSWTYGEPTASLNAVINGEYNTYVNGGFTALSLTITAEGTLNIEPNTAIVVINSVVNEANENSFQVESNGNLIQTNNSLNVGSILVKRDSSPMYRYDYTLWSSPVSGQNLRSFSPETLLDRFYSYNSSTGTNGAYETIFPANAPATYNFLPAKGYLIRSPDHYLGYQNTSTPGQVYTGSFIGIPQNGTISYNLSAENNGYNLVGNPYPSAISISSFFAANQNAIDGTIWFWRKRNGVPGTGYATTTGLGVTSVQPESAAMDPNNAINTAQGFFVKVKQNAMQNNLLFHNNMRQNANTSFFRNADEQTVEKHRIWLDLKLNNEIIGQTLIGYMQGATEGLDYGIDGKYFDDSPLSLSTMVNNTELAIQGRNLPFNTEDEVPLYFKTNVAGSFSISLSQFDGIFSEEQPVYLTDNNNLQTVNLKSGEYEFTTASGIFPNRFKIVYRNSLNIDTPKVDVNQIIISQQSSKVSIFAGKITIDNIKVYDLSGRLLLEKRNCDSSHFEISIDQIPNQVLIIQLTTNEQLIINKKIIR
ncbi:hypothetical protein GV828_04515 [Flavobacterium sp. NST-5]|uniref:Peptidase M14 domain-containing protein n=1 Tax=Flavobacterium ichthyis TaxID=2698827 RepID=A0ABW9Z7B9_9FLAO|nr:M14 family zinc carboxypeptidase [Flavobacterium ichthyis]NBL64462.1 hypothetical protein [Flavobacterium ichthyis]